MKRRALSPRPEWRAKAEAIGFTYHTHEHGPYWDESAYYEFSAAQVDVLEAAGNALHELCLAAAQAVIDRGWWSRLGIPQAAVAAIVESWERDDPSLYGRFDLAYDGVQPPKLLEYNADTPTALIEAAVAQWFWLQERFPGDDQFNSLHERLIDGWRAIAAERVHFTALPDSSEDTQTVTYLMDVCQQAGFQTAWLPLEALGWDPAQGQFVDERGDAVQALFKLYPWEWMWNEPFGTHLSTAKNLFIEPPWKLLLSNKGLLPVLWELFPDHPNLLPAFAEADPRLGGSFARKPRFSREGANVTLVRDGVVLEQTAGEYDDSGFVYQALAPIPDFAGHRPVCGVWMIQHAACGLGVREDTAWITSNVSRFVPHVLR